MICKTVVIKGTKRYSNWILSQRNWESHNGIRFICSHSVLMWHGGGGAHWSHCPKDTGNPGRHARRPGTFLWSDISIWASPWTCNYWQLFHSSRNPKRYIFAGIPKLFWLELSITYQWQNSQAHYLIMGIIILLLTKLKVMIYRHLFWNTSSCNLAINHRHPLPKQAASALRPPSTKPFCLRYVKRRLAYRGPT